jgi:SH3-like domain-containing protein
MYLKPRLLIAFIAIVVTAALTLSAGCKSAHTASKEIAYVSAPQVFLRDRVSAVYNKVGNLNNGERVQILQHDRRFVKVRTDAGLEGWVEQRYLADSAVFDQLAELAKKYVNAPAQAHAIVRNDVNMHVTPARDSDKLFQLKENDKLDLLQRAVTPKNVITKVALTPKPKPLIPQKEKDRDKKSPAPAATPVSAPAVEPALTTPPTPPDLGPLEDWWLVRDQNHRIGWVLGRMLDVDVPLEVAQYAEGKRVVAAFILNTIEDSESDKPNHQVPYYLMLTNEPHDGQPQDFNGLRVFTWNTRRHHYETAYREHDLNGIFPVTVTKEDFGKDGVLPAFTIHTKDETGATHDRKYRLEGVLVKRVYAPGEQPQPKLRTVNRESTTAKKSRSTVRHRSHRKHR